MSQSPKPKPDDFRSIGSNKRINIIGGSPLYITKSFRKSENESESCSTKKFSPVYGEKSNSSSNKKPNIFDPNSPESEGKNFSPDMMAIANIISEATYNQKVKAVDFGPIQSIFNGEPMEDFILWFRSFERRCNDRKLSQEVRLVTLKTYLSDTISARLERCSDASTGTYAALVETLKKSFPFTKFTPDLCLHEIRKVRQGIDETVADNATRLDMYLDIINTSEDHYLTQGQLFNYFLNGLKSRYRTRIRDMVETGAPIRDVQDVYRAACSLERSALKEAELHILNGVKLCEQCKFEPVTKVNSNICTDCYNQRIIFKDPDRGNQESKPRRGNDSSNDSSYRDSESPKENKPKEETSEVAIDWKTFDVVNTFIPPLKSDDSNYDPLYWSGRKLHKEFRCPLCGQPVMNTSIHPNKAPCPDFPNYAPHEVRRLRVQAGVKKPPERKFKPPNPYWIKDAPESF